MNAIFQGVNYEKNIKRNGEETRMTQVASHSEGKNMARPRQQAELIARGVAQELRDGFYVNLNRHAHPGRELYSAGMDVVCNRKTACWASAVHEGEEDADLINAGKKRSRRFPGRAIFQLRFVRNDSAPM